MVAETFIRLGGDPGLPGIITAGKGWDFLHGHLHDRLLEIGDVLHLELCPRIAGYSAPMMRDVVIGPMPAELRRAAETLSSLQDKQIAALKPGAEATAIDRILRQGLIESGLRKNYDNITGYTIRYYSDYMIRGSDFTWVFHPKADWVVEAGMVFHMYTSAAGISLSDTVLVGDYGPEFLTRTERKLFATMQGGQGDSFRHEVLSASAAPYATACYGRECGKPSSIARAARMSAVPKPSVKRL